MSLLARNHAMGVRRPLALAVFLCGMASLGTDCGTTLFRIEVGGNVDSHVVFRPLENLGREVTMKEFVVAECDSHNATCQIVWRLQGEARVRSIVYGEAPDGLNTLVGPVPLRRGGRYTVGMLAEVYDITRLRGGGSCDFTVDAGGDVATRGANGCRLFAGQGL